MKWGGIMYRKILSYSRKYPEAMAGYFCSSVMGIAGVSLSVSSIINKKTDELLLGLYLLSVSLPIWLTSKAWVKTENSKYREFEKKIEQSGFSDEIMMKCERFESIQRLVKNISLEKGLLNEYEKSLSEYRRRGSRYASYYSREIV